MDLLYEKINNDRKRRTRLRVFLLLVTVVSGVVFTNAVIHFIARLQCDRRDALAGIVRRNRADARRIESITGTVRQMVDDIAARIEQAPFDEKGLRVILSHRNADTLCPFSVGFRFDGSFPVQRLTRTQAGSENVRVFDSSVTYSRWSGIAGSDSSDGWKKTDCKGGVSCGSVSYQKRLYRVSSQGVRVPIGVVSAKVPLENIEQAMDVYDMGNYGYRVVFDGDGQLLVHPVKELVREGFRFREYAIRYYTPEQKKQVFDAFRYQQTAVVEDIKNIISGQTSILCLEPVHSTGWMAGMVMVENELAVPNTIVRREVLIILLTFILFMFAAGFVRVVYSPAPDILGKRLRRFSWFVSILFIAGLAVIWIAQVFLGDRSLHDYESITMRAQIERYKKAYTKKALLAGLQVPVFIQTGVMISSVRLSEAAQMVELTGLLWQRVPDSLSFEQAAGFSFPDEIDTKKSEVYRQRDGDATVTGWRFYTKITQNFRSSIYPFDRIEVNLRVHSPKDYASVLFIPDLAAYRIISPSSSPMVERDNRMAGWQIDQSYMKFGSDRNSKSVDYGFHQTDTMPVQNELVLVLSIGRDWVSSFISVLIPVLAIFSILYSSIYMITNQDEMRKQFNFNAMSASSIGSGLTLFVVIAIQNVRAKVIPEGILYVEKIYFIIYLAILVNVAIAISVTEKKGFFLTYRNGLIVRYLYWPFYAGILFLVTFIEFY